MGNDEGALWFPVSAITLKLAPISGSWGNYCSSFKIYNEDQIREAVELLYAVPYSRSAISLELRQKTTPYKTAPSIDRYETNQGSHLIEQKG